MTLDQMLKLDPFFSRSGVEPESTIAIPQQTYETIEALYSLYEKMTVGTYGGDSSHLNMPYSLLGSAEPTPLQIELLTEKIIRSGNSLIGQVITSRYINGLIQRSYSLGHNNFRLSTGDQYLTYFLNDFQAEKNRPLCVTVLGNIGMGCGTDSKYLDINIIGVVGPLCGRCAEHSRFKIHDRAYGMLGDCSTGNEFILEGFIRGSTGMSDALIGRSVTSCKFKTHSAEAFAQMIDKSNVEHELFNSTFQLLDQNENVIKKKYFLIRKLFPEGDE